MDACVCCGHLPGCWCCSTSFVLQPGGCLGRDEHIHIGSRVFGFAAIFGCCCFSCDLSNDSREIPLLNCCFVPRDWEQVPDRNVCCCIPYIRSSFPSKDSGNAGGLSP